MSDSDQVLEVGPTGIDAVIELSKRYQSTLGQLPFEAFRLFAKERRVVASFSGQRITGYAIYRVRKRTGALVLVHLCVDADSRGGNTAQQLVDTVCGRHPYAPGLAAWCREDYPAHRRWPSLGFSRTGDRPGRSRAGSKLVHWWRPINELTLFTLVPDDEVPTAVIDTNVFRDIVEPRLQFTQSIALSEPWLLDSVRLAITDHLVTEVTEACAFAPQLRGTTSRFKKLSPSVSDWRPIFEELSVALGRSTIEDGDRRQLAQAAAGEARYFVTRDEGFLAKCEVIEGVTGLTALSPLDLTLALHADQFELMYRPEALRESEWEIRRPTTLPTTVALQEFADQPRERPSDLHAGFRDALASVGSGARLWELGSAEGGHPMALAATTVEGRSLVAHCVRVRKSRDRVTFARQAVHLLREEAVGAGLARVLVPGVAPAYLEQALVAEGFVEADGGWLARCQRGFLGPGDTVPELGRGVRAADLDPGQVSQLERVLWPIKILSGGVPSYIVPIQPAWARALFDDSPMQAELFSRPRQLGLAREHVYFRALARHIEAPARLLWWVSGGGPNSGMRAASWLEDVVHGRPLTLYRRFGSQGIYSPADVEQVHHRVGGEITALVFSRTETFVESITLTRARGLHAEMRTNGYLQTARRVSEHVFATFYQYGRPL